MFAARGYGRKNESKGRNGARDTEMERRKQRERGEVETGFDRYAFPLARVHARSYWLARGTRAVIELRYVRIRRSVCKRIASSRDFLLDVNTVSRTLVHSPVHVHARPGPVRFTASYTPYKDEEEEEEKEGTWLSVQFTASQAKSAYPRAGSRRLTARDRRRRGFFSR